MAPGTGAAPERPAAPRDELARGHRAAIERLAGAGSWSAAEVARLAESLLVDPARFGAEPAFRERVVPAIAGALPPGTPAALRDALLVELSRVTGLLELAPVERAWGGARRSIVDRRVGGSPARPADRTAWPKLRLGPAEAPIALSVYSLGSSFFGAEEAEGFLRAVRGWAPDRALVVLADHRQGEALAATASRLGIELIPTWGRSYSPWPRDPMSFLVREDGSRIALLRPNRQPGRETDAAMGLELVQDLPPALDARLGSLTWAVAPVPFHNGNLLESPEAIWLSIHALEPRILEILQLDRVPVESFGSVAGVERYLGAARTAASELERLFGKPVRFVHALPLQAGAGGAEPAAIADDELAAAMGRLGGGAGFDLDSLVTLLPSSPGGPAALIGDPAAGSALIAAGPDSELGRLRAAYGLAAAPGGSVEALRAAIDRWHQGPRARGLAAFLDLVAEHLAGLGFGVHRLPLVLAPTPLLERAADYPDPDFLIGWNNVVLEVAGDRRRAEGFATLLDGGDARARALFAELGYELELLPPLIESVLRNGGYRCASSHIREATGAGD